MNGDWGMKIEPERPPRWPSIVFAVAAGVIIVAAAARYAYIRGRLDQQSETVALLAEKLKDAGIETSDADLPKLFPAPRDGE